eukprot:TRINITY_DN6600_c0_g2_i1.p1 TRINITY_DN6600_c0_g2~~TRINITY_DN6600_c0_g2_i1.p1  ORF type:complete len:851 (-),score=192.60 TRINITY_DN6600_c0_g2_i1:561-3113(-)
MNSFPFTRNSGFCTFVRPQDSAIWLPSSINSSSNRTILTIRSKAAKRLVCNAESGIAKHVSVKDQATQERARKLFEKIREAEKERIEKMDDLQRKAMIQFEREHVLAASWRNAFLKFIGKLKGTVWDPEPSHKITFSEFWNLLENNQVRFIEYRNLGESVAVILPHYKDRRREVEEANDTSNSAKKEVVFRRHAVRRMPADSWTDVWRKLHQQLVDINVIDTSSLRYSLYSSTSMLVVWALRTALIVLLYVWSRRFVKKRKACQQIFLEPRAWFVEQLSTWFEPIETFYRTGYFTLPRTTVITEEQRTGVTFDDFAGQNYVKSEVQEIVRLLRGDRDYAKLGAYCPPGLLFYGPPGTGKTLLARAIAGEAGVPFFAANGSSFVEMFEGVAPLRVKNLFQQAKSMAPSIIFIDEVDAIGARRLDSEDIGGDTERQQALLEMLVQFDTITNYDMGDQVLVIGATNRVDILDAALVRKGRFDKILMVGLPSEQGRVEILRVHSRNKSFRTEEEKEVLLKEVAKDAVDFSGAALENVLNEAAILCQRKNKPFIEREDLKESMQRQQGSFATGIEEYREIPLQLKIRLAYREAAVAILECYYPNPARPFVKTNILSVDEKPNMEYGSRGHNYFARKSDYINLIIRACAPRVIEEEMFGKENLSAVSGLPATEAGLYADYLILGTGMTPIGKVHYLTESDVMLHIGPKIEALRDEYIRYGMETCASVLRECRSAVQTLVDILLEKDEITADEIWEVFRNSSRSPQPKVRPLDEYGALLYAGRWGIHGATLPGRATFSPGNVGYVTYGAPCPQNTQVITDETWKTIDAIQERTLKSLREKLQEKKQVSDILTGEHYL